MKKTFFEFRIKQRSIQKHTQMMNNLKTYLSAYRNEIILHKQRREHENQNDCSEKTENSEQQSAFLHGSSHCPIRKFTSSIIIMEKKWNDE